jgi:predicted porin
MKKTLVALAALAATGAFAQSTVTLSGNLDFAAATISGTQTLAQGSTVSTGVGTASTSVINLVAEETVTGGFKITAKYGLDPRGLANDSLAVTNNTTSAVTAGERAAAPANTTTGLARDEAFIGISGGFGNLRLGAPNSIGLNSFQVASPLGTGVGSGYTGGSTAATMTNSFVQTRYSRSVRYDSPSFNGITLSALYAPGNDAAVLRVSNVAAAVLIPNARQATEFGLRYAAGPMTVSYAYVAQGAQSNPTGWYSGTAQTLDKTAVSMLNASYVMGNTALSAGWNNGDRLASFGATDATAVDTNGYRLGIRHTMGNIDLGASYTRQTANSGGTTSARSDVTAKVTGLRADYNFSKTAAAYVGYENWDTGAAYSEAAVASALTTGTRKIVSIGLRKSF